MYSLSSSLIPDQAPIYLEQASPSVYPARIVEQKWPRGIVPKVSFFCITYNHLKYIRDTIEGFLMQETTFPVEIFIHDDASTDGTVDIIKEYAAKYPPLFRPCFQNKNQYSLEGFKHFFSYSSDQRGEFIALCEGDDYWIDRNKIQKQVELMEANNLASFCFHRTHVINDKQEASGEIGPKKNKKIFKIEDLFPDNFIHTSSVLYRKSMFSGFPRCLEKSPVADWPLFILLAERGPFLYLDEIMSHYRLHTTGTWSGKPKAERLEKTCYMFELMLDYFKGNKDCLRFVKKSLKKHRKAVAREFRKNWRLSKFLSILDGGCN